MNLWIVGKAIAPSGWEFCGVFSSKEKADAACISKAYFIGPATLNEAISDVTEEWVGSYFPRDSA